MNAEHHGLVRTYTHQKCRCDECVRAANDYFSEYRKKRYSERVDIDGTPIAIHVPREMHGNLSTYTTHGCRCDDCAKAMRDYRLSRRRSKDAS